MNIILFLIGLYKHYFCKCYINDFTYYYPNIEWCYFPFALVECLIILYIFTGIKNCKKYETEKEAKKKKYEAMKKTATIPAKEATKETIKEIILSYIPVKINISYTKIYYHVNSKIIPDVSSEFIDSLLIELEEEHKIDMVIINNESYFSKPQD
jgi:hypothetical protein